MKTPDEIKRALDCCSYLHPVCEECPYYPTFCDNVMIKDALEYIQQLEAERYALIEELKNAYSCFACKKFQRNGGECKAGGVCLMRDFEWRGVQKEE